MVSAPAYGLDPGLAVTQASADDAQATPPAGAALQPSQSDRSDQSARPQEVQFEAEQLAYDNAKDTVLARGNVVLRSGDRSVRADEVVWVRAEGRIYAAGNIRLVDEGGTSSTQTLSS